jgi:hypothetical protein
MKKVLLLTGFMTLGLFAADTSQYSYQSQQRAYEQAKGKGDMNQHRYRKGDGSGDGKKHQHRYGQNGGKGSQGGGRGGKH